MRWLEYLARFDFDIKDVPGTANTVADALSRRYASDTEDDHRGDHEYVSIDVRLDPEGEDSPGIPVMGGRIRRPPVKIPELRETEELRATQSRKLNVHTPSGYEGQKIPLKAVDKLQLPLRRDLAPLVETTELMTTIRGALKNDKFFGRICADITAHWDFEWRDEILYHKPWNVLGIPEVLFKRRKVAEIIIDLGHKCSVIWAQRRQWRTLAAGTGGQQSPAKYNMSATRVATVRC